MTIKNNPLTSSATDLSPHLLFPLLDYWLKSKLNSCPVCHFSNPSPPYCLKDTSLEGKWPQSTGLKVCLVSWWNLVST